MLAGLYARRALDFRALRNERIAASKRRSSLAFITVTRARRSPGVMLNSSCCGAR